MATHIPFLKEQRRLKNKNKSKEVNKPRKLIGINEALLKFFNFGAK